MTCKNVHSDIFVRPTVKVSKAKEDQNLKLFQMAKVTMSTFFVRPTVKGSKVFKEGQNLKLFEMANITKSTC